MKIEVNNKEVKSEKAPKVGASMKQLLNQRDTKTVAGGWQSTLPPRR